MTADAMLLAGGAALVATLALLAGVPSRYIRGRLRFTLLLVLASLALHGAIRQGIGDADLLGGLSRLSLVVAILNLVLSLAINPWREHRASERFPAIVQDVALIALFAVLATVWMNEQLLVTSAVGAAVVGFALQDTLGNLFAGLAIQIEKPFRVGHWIAVGEREGQVQEITWRATKLLTKHGQFLIVPNGVISTEAILNYSEPTVPTRLTVAVGVSYATPPNEARAALLEALAHSPLVLRVPAPRVFLHDFGDSALIFHLWFWISDYALELEARDEVRTNIWYTLRRKGIEIPYPIQVEISREDAPPRSERDVEVAASALGAVDLFSELPPDARLALSRAASEQIFAVGEPIVQQGEPGSSMYVVLSGRVQVVLEPSNREVATIGPGGFFGEMSLLTGEPRSATVRAASDVRVLEITAERFREIALARPGLVEHMARVVSARRGELDEIRAAASSTAVVNAAPRTLLSRVKQFLRLP